MGGMPMRGIAVLLAYLVGLSALLSVGVIGVMAFHSSTKPIPPAQPVVTASQKERLAKPAKQTTTVTQKEARPQKRKKPEPFEFRPVTRSGKSLRVGAP